MYTLPSFGAVALPLTCVASVLYLISVKTGTRIEINVAVHRTSETRSPSSLQQNLRAGGGRNKMTKPSSEGVGALSPDDAVITTAASLADIDASIPSCARDAFVTLHRELDGEVESTCRGMLISDDVIVTSRECSAYNFTFEYPRLGVVDAPARPHATLRSSSDLGFLKVRPPHHYHFVGKQARRARVFLSLDTEPNIANFNGTDAFFNGTTAGGEDGTGIPAVFSCSGPRPVAHIFPVARKDGTGTKMVPIRQLKGVVPPDDILWEHTDLHTAVMLSYKSELWWTHPIDLADEEKTIQNMLKKYKGPPGSLSIPDAHSDYVGKASALMEAVDPRGHRRGDCFKSYFARWRAETPFSGMHFFDWLDYGHGKFLLETNDVLPAFQPMPKDEKCHKATFNKKTVKYLNEEERQSHEVYITPSTDGTELIARYRNNDEPVPESREDDPHLYMWDLDKKLYVVDNTWDHDKYGTVKHTGLMGGKPALSAGKAYFGKNGAIWGINYSSGHYRPDISALAMMYQWMKDMQFNLTALHWVGREAWSSKDCERIDWGGIQIPGFDRDDLKQSCLEATASPTWINKEDV